MKHNPADQNNKPNKSNKTKIVSPTQHDLPLIYKWVEVSLQEKKMLQRWALGNLLKRLLFEDLALVELSAFVVGASPWEILRD